MDFIQIERALLSLSVEELKLLKKQCLYLIKIQSKLEAPLSEDPDVEKELLYGFLFEHFSGVAPPNYGMFKKRCRTQVPLFNEMFLYIKNLIKLQHLPETRAVFLKLGHFVLGLIIMDLRKSAIPCCLKVLLNTRRWELFQSILEKDFPGYLHSGLMCKFLHIERE